MMILAMIRTEINTIESLYEELLTENGCVVIVVQSVWRMQNMVVKGQFMDKLYTQDWKVILWEIQLSGEGVGIKKCVSRVKNREVSMDQ